MGKLISIFKRMIAFCKASRNRQRKIVLSPIPLEWQKTISLANFTIESIHGFGITSDMFFDVSRQTLLIRLINYRNHAWCEIGWDKRPDMWLNYSLVLQYIHIPDLTIPDNYEQMINYIFSPENLCTLERVQLIIEQDGFIDLARGIVALQRNDWF